MKIRTEIMNILYGRKSYLSRGTIFEEEQYPNSPLNYALVTSSKDEHVKCYKCKYTNTNWCWNCEKPHCDKHAMAIFIFPMINTFCLECAKELEKLNKENKNDERN